MRAFIRLSARRKILFFVTVVLSFYTYMLMRFFRKKANFDLKRKHFSGRVNDSVVRDIRWAIRVVNKYVPWENVCRHQAYQALLLCRYYDIPYKIFIGFRKNPEAGKIEGHAWTVVNGEIITGFCNTEEYTVQSIFSGG